MMKMMMMMRMKMIDEMIVCVEEYMRQGLEAEWIDPHSDWVDENWQKIAHSFPFVKGVNQQINMLTKKLI